MLPPVSDAADTVELRYRYRLRVTPARQRQLQQVFDNNRFVWNHMLGRWTDLWRHEQTSLNTVEMSRELTDLRSRFDWLEATPVTPQQQTVRDLGKAISAFFDKKNPAGRPRFREKGTVNSGRWTKRGFGVTGTGCGMKGDRLTIALPGGRVEVPVVWSRPLPSEPSSVTVSVDAEGYWWASFVVTVPVEHVPLPDTTTGLDVGLTTLVTASDPSGDIPNPRFSKNDISVLRRADSRSGRGRRDERPSEKTRRRRARAHGKVARRRLDHHRKTARQIARSYGQIGVEDLRIKNMLANHSLARHISDAGWGMWLAELDHQRRKIGAPPALRQDARNTTQNCSRCGTKAKSRLTLSDRVFVCGSCGHTDCRDRNAAHNLDPGRRPDPRLVSSARECTPARTGAGGVTTDVRPRAAAVTQGIPSARIPRL